MDSLRTAEETLALNGAMFDVAIIGGGINGVAIARECARAGRRTLLVEQHDFSSGTTSRSTRLIHGGLRYLEHGEIGLVRESLRERERLAREHPHLVRPVEFLLALPPGSRHSALALRAGLWVYHRLGARVLGQSQQARILEAALDRGAAWTIFSYGDAQCEFPERLVAEWLSDALAAGATALNHTEVLEILAREGKVSSLRLRDRFTGAEITVSAKHVFNATGPWVDRLLERAPLSRSKRLLGGVRGSHIVTSRFPGAPGSAVYTESSDGRPFFAIPWNGQILAGTTEVADSGDPSNARATPEEVDYLKRALVRLFPAAADATIHYAYAGIRPLPNSNGNALGAITRRHHLHDHALDGLYGLVSLVGGKLTTALAAAHDCLAQLGNAQRHSDPFPVAHAPADGIESSLRQWSVSVAARAGISPEAARALAEWHGRSALCIASLASQAEELRAPLCPHTHHLVAEAVMAVRRERAVTLADVLLRRVPVTLSACWSAECAERASSRIAAAVGWSPRLAAEQLEQFEAERASFLQSVSGMPQLPPRAESAA